MILISINLIHCYTIYNFYHLVYDFTFCSRFTFLFYLEICDTFVYISGLNFEINPVKAGEKRKLEELNQDLNNKTAENSNGNSKPPTKKMKISASDKNPVMLLNELKPGLKYEVEECGDSPATKRFVMTVSIDNHSFEGSGASKKLAKQACARMALTTLYNFSFTPGLTMETDSEGQEEKDQKVPGIAQFSNFFAS